MLLEYFGKCGNSARQILPAYSLQLSMGLGANARAIKSDE